MRGQGHQPRATRRAPPVLRPEAQAPNADLRMTTGGLRPLFFGRSLVQKVTEAVEHVD